MNTTANIKFNLKEEDIMLSAYVCPYYIYYGKDGIIYVWVSAEKEATVKDTQKLSDTIGKLVNYKKVPAVGRFEDFAIPSPEVRTFWANRTSCPYLLAEAFIIDTLAMKLIADFYLRVNKPQRPTKIVDSIADAKEWLKTFIN